MFWLLVTLVASFLVTLAVTPKLIVKLRGTGITGKDIHKKRKTEVPEMGGLAILFGMCAGIFVSIPFIGEGMVFLLAAFATILIVGMLGVCDDLFGIKFRTKSLLPFFAAIPLMAVQAGTHSMNIPFIGAVNLGLLYPVILIPLAISVVANSSNMLAGYNGMEAGMGAIACFFMGVAAVALGRLEAAAIMLSMSGACVAFLKYNKYPSKIFVGDVGTFSIGAAIAAAAIIGNMEVIGMIVIAPYILNGLITTLDIFRRKPIQKFSTIKDGVLVPPPKTHTNALYFVMQRVGTMTEKKMTESMWLLGIMSGLVAMLVLLVQI